MIGRIQGILLEKQAPEILVDIQGVGYEIQVPMNTYYQLPEPGVEILLYTHFVVREDAQILFGFFQQSDRQLFRQLIRVNGVGPKMALAILSGMEAAEFALCVQSKDISSLTRLPGVGKKTAERLVIEMKDKVDSIPVTTEEHPGAETTSSEKMSIRRHQQDAVAALIALGYSQQQSEKAVKNVLQQAENSEQMIRLALQSVL